LLKHPGKIVGGSVRFGDTDLTKLSNDEMQALRGRDVSMVFQNPRSSLNPVLTVGQQMIQILRYRRGMGKSDAHKEVIRLLELVRIPEPERRMKAYAHQLSGGMAQRVMIAMAISCSPRLLIADEPTTGLDVTIEYQIIQLLREMRDRTGTSVVIITHDLNMAAEICDRIMVMYAGKIVEQAPVADFFTQPRHPYTIGLLASRPHLSLSGDIPTIPGNVPDLINRPTGCAFHPRCRWATDRCKQDVPELRQMSAGHFAACHNIEDVARDVVTSG
jgi:oligopeptide/dipeptide ABC transporter ATP-binding protein